MNPDPSSSSGGKRPSNKKSPPSKDLRSSSEEADLWDLDSPATPPKEETPPPEPIAPPPLPEPAAHEEIPDPADEDSAVPAPIPRTPRGQRRESVPFQRFSAKSRLSTDLPGPETPAAPSAEPSETGTARRQGRPSAPERRPVVDTFDALEATLAKHPETGQIAPPPLPPAEEPSPAATADPIPPQEEPSASVQETAPAPDPQPAPSPAAPSPSAGLSKVEKIGLLSFLALFLAAGVFFLIYSIGKLPGEVKALTPGDFPIKGQHFEAAKFRSYWRDPVATDTVRRGTLVIPVIEIETKGGPAAIRAFFKNSEGATVGDAVTRAVNGETTLVIPATAGFDEEGQHAAYRAGDSKPWTVEVYEGPSASASGRDFKKLFDIPISTNVR